MHTPRDKRVFDKEAVSLVQAGFEVAHLAPGEEGRIRERGVDLITYRPPQGIKDRLLQIPRLYRLAANIEAGCYHCNEVDSWLVGILLKIFRRKKIVFDVHEHYPSTFAESRFPRWLQPIIAGAIRLVFSILTPFTDYLVFAKRSVAPDFKGSAHKQLLVQNFTSLAYVNGHHSTDGQQAPRGDGSITAIHLGLISRMRGWPQLLEAVARMKVDNLRLHIVGTFNDGSQADFERSVAELGLEQKILVEGWMPFEQAYQRMLKADIGLVLFQPGIQNHVYALPHKMFDYMLARLPVIAPQFAEEVAPIIEAAHCGLLIDPSNPDEIARALDRLATDPDRRNQLGNNGRQAVLETYNWETEAEKLIKMYTTMSKDLR